MSNGRGKILVVSAPSGTGKTTILREVLKRHQEVVYSVSATTRQKRANERDGIDYFFITEDEFLKRIENREFAEWEKVYDYYYGTLKRFIDDTVSAGKHILLELDVKGALSIKKIYNEAALIFIEPPSIEALRERLMRRKTETEQDLAKRLGRAEMELQQKEHFEYHLVNSDISKAVEEFDIMLKNLIKGK